MSETHVGLTIAVDVRSRAPGARLAEEIECAAFSDVEEQSHVALTPRRALDQL